MIPRSQGHCYLRHLHCHHHCPVWPETGGNPRCCPGPQGLDLSRSRNRRLASQGWHKSRGWRHRCHPQRWERATCGMVAGWPAYHPGTPLSILVTRRSRPLEASGPPCWLGRACGGDLGKLSRCLCPLLAAHSAVSPALSTTPRTQEGLRECGQKGEGKPCPPKPNPMLGLAAKESQQYLAGMGPPLWTFVPAQ